MQQPGRNGPLPQGRTGKKDLADLAEFRLESALGPSTEAIVKEAEAKHIPWMQLPTRAMIQLGLRSLPAAGPGHPQQPHQHPRGGAGLR